MALRARIVVEDASIRDDTPRSYAFGKALVGVSARVSVAQPQRSVSACAGAQGAQRGHRIVLALLGCLAFVVCASLHRVAQAHAVASSTTASQASCNPSEHELVKSTAEPPRYEPRHDVTHASELKALEPQDSEQKTALDVSVQSVVAARLSPILPLASPAPHVASAIQCRSRVFLTSASPRGPPSIRR